MRRGCFDVPYDSWIRQPVGPNGGCFPRPRPVDPFERFW